MKAILTSLPQAAGRVECDAAHRVLSTVLDTDAARDGDHCCRLADEAAPNRSGIPHTQPCRETAWEHTAFLLESHVLACSSNHQNTAARHSTSPEEIGKQVSHWPQTETSHSGMSALAAAMTTSNGQTSIRKEE